MIYVCLFAFSCLELSLKKIVQITFTAIASHSHAASRGFHICIKALPNCSVPIHSILYYSIYIFKKTCEKNNSSERK